MSFSSCVMLTAPTRKQFVIMMRNLRYFNCILSLHLYYCDFVTSCVPIAAFSAVSICILTADHTCSETFNIYACCMHVCVYIWYTTYICICADMCTHFMHTYDMYVCNVCAADLSPTVFVNLHFSNL